MVVNLLGVAENVRMLRRLRRVEREARAVLRQARRSIRRRELRRLGNLN